MRAGRFALLLASWMLGAASQPERVDLLIRGGTIYTGDQEPFVGDVLIEGDRIVRVIRYQENVVATFFHDVPTHDEQISWTRPPVEIIADREIDATDMVVAPGFIDPHTHAGAQLASDDPQQRLISAFLMQGVTTAFIGNDGGGDPDVAAVLGSAARKPVGINYAAYVGFGAVRSAVIGEADRPPTPSELVRMRQMVAGAMCQGALGLSTGLFYAPQSFARTDEVVALAREAGARGGVYDSHIRDESSYSIGLAAAVDEAIAIGSEAGLPVNISHIKALGVDVHGQAPAIIASVEGARAAGQRVTADQYPWSASGTSLVAALVPPWAQDGGRAALLRRLDDGAVSARLRAEMADNLRRRGGAASLLITEGRHRGRRLSQIAGSSDPIGAAIGVIRIADPAVASFNQTEADIAAFMARPWVMTGSDASAGHPRMFGSFARKYAEYVVRRRVLSLRDFIERSTSLTADTFGIADRGRLRPGAFADVIVFDPTSYAARATYDQPSLTATGTRAVLVNGQVAVEDGALTGVAAGRGLAKTPPEGTCI